MRHLDRFPPLPVSPLLNLVEIAPAKPQNDLFRSNPFRPCPLQKTPKFADRSRADPIERCHFLAEFFIAAHEDSSVRKPKITNNFRKKSSLLDVRLHEENLQLGLNNLQWKPRKTATLAHVGEPTFPQGHRYSRVHALA